MNKTFQKQNHPDWDTEPYNGISQFLPVNKMWCISQASKCQNI